MSLRRVNLSYSRWLYVLALLLVLTSRSAQPTQATTTEIANGDVAGLIAAINAANTHWNTDTIRLARNGLYTLTEAEHTDALGPTGLPPIRSPIIIVGNGATIERDMASETPEFRILRVDTGGALTLQRVTITGGRAAVLPAFGGGIFVSSGSTSVTLDQSIVTNNWSASFGGGISIIGPTVIKGGTSIDHNSSVDGGGIFCGYGCWLEMTDSAITDNEATFGGGILNDNGTHFLVARSLFANNHALWWGGGILSVSFGGNADFGTILKVDHTTLANNRASVGGGIYHNTGLADITHSTFSDNQSDRNGGGLASLEQSGHWGQLTVTNSTFSGNQAGMQGGGLYTQREPTIGFLTVVGNQAQDGGGIYHQGGMLRLASSILTQNLPSNCTSGAIISQGYNLASDQSCQLTMPSDLVNKDLGLGQLMDNGGATATYALLPENPAVDRTPQGKNGCGNIITDDQRGFRRPQGKACDSGAFELLPNLLRNPDFESGVGGWEFYTNGQGTLSNDSPGYQGVASGRIDIDSPGSNVQLYQRGFALEPETRYRLQFTAKSSTGHDLSVYLQQESSPSPSYGIRNFRANLTDDWKTFTIYFTTKNFTTPTNDTRLRFWLAKLAQGGDVYWIDDLSLVKVTQQVTAAGTDLASGRLQGVVQGVNAPVPVTLIDLETDRAIATTTTGAAGGFEFVELVYGNYEVQLTPPAGYLTPEPVQLAVTAEPQEDLVFTLETATNQIYLPTIQR